MRHVLIFGATSAIAAEVAVLHARRGDRLHLVGRNRDKLAAVASRCGAAATTQHADFAELSGNETVVHDAQHIDRGYDRFDHALRTLGADVRRISA